MYIVLPLLGAIVGLALYIIVRKLVLGGRANGLLEKAELDAENIKQQKILQAKEKYLQKQYMMKKITA